MRGVLSAHVQRVLPKAIAKAMILFLFIIVYVYNVYSIVSPLKRGIMCFLFIMQSLCRINLHGLTGRDADTDGNHQGYQQEADGTAKEEATRF